MKRTVFLLFILLSGFASARAALDRVLVVVNDDVVTQSELDARIPNVKKQLERQHIRIPPEDVLRRGVLDRMIVERLQLQVATQMGIEVDKDRIDQAIARIAADNRLDVPGFMAVLKSEGIPAAEFREQIRTQLIVQQLVDREINSRVNVSDSEVQSFLARNRDAVAEYNLSHILLAVPENATPDAIQAAKRRADNLWQQLSDGGDFEQLAIANSQDDKALEAGNIGWKKAGQLPPLFLSALEKLAVGSISPVLRSPNGFHILKLNDKRGGNEAMPVRQSHVRHILIKPTELLSDAEAKTKLGNLRERIAQGEDFAALAKANSDDAGSGSNGGDLGWISPGQTVPAFERAMDKLDIGALSAPVRSPFGWHLIQVLARRDQDMGAERRVAEARQQLHTRKADERYEQWLRQLRDEAYVEYKNL